MSEAIMSETIEGETFEPEAEASAASVSESVASADPQAGTVAARMVTAFLAAFCGKTDRIAPAETARIVTYGPGVTARVTLHARKPAEVSDGRAWYHVAAGRSSSARREGYLRAALVKIALTVATGDEKGAKLAMGAFGAEAPEGPKPEQWARALEKASGAIGEAYAALVAAQDGYAFPFGSAPVKSGKMAHRWYVFYTNADGKEAKFYIPNLFVPSTGYDPMRDGEGTEADDPDEIVTTMVVGKIERTVTLKRVMVRK